MDWFGGVAVGFLYSLRNWQLDDMILASEQIFFWKKGGGGVIGKTRDLMCRRKAYFCLDVDKCSVLLWMGMEAHEK